MCQPKPNIMHLTPAAESTNHNQWYTQNNKPYIQDMRKEDHIGENKLHDAVGLMWLRNEYIDYEH
jgi:hypothetical protein